jgi:predicted  nucleic acid-binding Zn-ribbon protein
MVMLVRLTSSTSGEIIMFAEHVHTLFEWIGKETTARGVFTKEQLPEAIARLRHGVEEEKEAAKRLAEEKRANAEKNRNTEEEDDENGDDDEKQKEPEETVSLGQRAQPLINMMQWTLKEDGFILWEASQDF